MQMNVISVVFALFEVVESNALGFALRRRSDPEHPAKPAVEATPMFIATGPPCSLNNFGVIGC
jgi:hypothetical protein